MSQQLVVRGTFIHLDEKDTTECFAGHRAERRRRSSSWSPSLQQDCVSPAVDATHALLNCKSTTAGDLDATGPAHHQVKTCDAANNGSVVDSRETLSLKISRMESLQHTDATATSCPASEVHPNQWSTNVIHSSTQKEDLRTTVIFQNLPRDLSQGEFKQLLDFNGFAGWYDYVYMPVDVGQHAVLLGFAFVNLVMPAIVEEFWKFFDGCRIGDKVCRLKWSRFQGLDCHVQLFRNSLMMRKDIDDVDPEVPAGALSKLVVCYVPVLLARFVLSRITKSATSSDRQTQLRQESQRWAHEVRPFGPTGIWCFAPLVKHHLLQLGRLISDDQNACLFEKFASEERKGYGLRGIEWFEDYYVISQKGMQPAFNFPMQTMYEFCLAQ